MWEHCSNSSLCCLRSLRWTKPEYYIFGGNWLFLRAHLAASGLQWTSMYCFRRTEASCRTGSAPSLCGTNKVVAGKSRSWVISNVDKISSEEHDKQWNLKCELCKVEAKLIGHFKRLHLLFRSASRHLGFNFTSWSSWASSTQSPRHNNLILARSRTTWSVAIKPPMVSMRAALRPESVILSASDLDWKFSLLNQQPLTTSVPNSRFTESEVFKFPHNTFYNLHCYYISSQRIQERCFQFIGQRTQCGLFLKCEYVITWYKMWNWSESNIIAQFLVHVSLANQYARISSR